jgi:phosphotransacetylase
MAIKKLTKLIELAQKIPRKRVVVAYAMDETTILATKRAIELNLAEFTLVGNKQVIEKIVLIMILILVFILSQM